MPSYRDLALDLTTKVNAALEKRDELDKTYQSIRAKVHMSRAENNQLLDMLSEAYPEVDDNDLSSNSSSDNDDFADTAPLRRKRDYMPPAALAAHDSLARITKRRRCQGRRSCRAEPKPVESLERDSQGAITFPIVIGKGQDKIQIHALGHVVWDREAYHTSRYIWTPGFKSTRTYPSLLGNDTRCMYTSEILDGGDAPIFQVTAEDMADTPFRATSSSAAWKQILDQLTSMGVGAKTHASGPQMYGLSHLGVTKAIQELENADKCQKYIRQQWATKSVSAASTDDEEDNDNDDNNDDQNLA
ncbi:hypothetical protein GGI21_000888 [Coemansia aciculifera]|uniref:Uncharacterized protein n=1 Tax=Coemansia aciculifera TaxID=417176 RepID=A0ACC1M557_9FUNG|nr:hypothetical protein IWW38_002409 [Coemansia aciculifera]KAJ2910425.1 hypothetical protein GGI21_000888 [Coemansia aciculifera]